MLSLRHYEVSEIDPPFWQMCANPTKGVFLCHVISGSWLSTMDSYQQCRTSLRLHKQICHQISVQFQWRTALSNQRACRELVQWEIEGWFWEEVEGHIIWVRTRISSCAVKNTRISKQTSGRHLPQWRMDSPVNRWHVENASQLFLKKLQLHPVCQSCLW